LFTEMGDLFTYVLPFYGISLLFMINTSANNAKNMITHFLPDKYAKQKLIQLLIFTLISIMVNCLGWALGKGIIVVLVIVTGFLFFI
jgi:hypothetical protein